MTRDRVLNIHTVNAALRRGLGRRGGGNVGLPDVGKGW